MSSTLKLTIDEMQRAFGALHKLDHYDDGGERKTYHLDSSTRWNIAKNIKILRGELELFEELRTAKIRELSPQKLDIEQEEKTTLDQWNQWFKNETMRVPREVNGLLRLKRSKVFLSVNPIPGTVAEGLMPLIDEDGPLPE